MVVWVKRKGIITKPAKPRNLASLLLRLSSSFVLGFPSLCAFLTLTARTPPVHRLHQHVDLVVFVVVVGVSVPGAVRVFIVKGEPLALPSYPSSSVMHRGCTLYQAVVYHSSPLTDLCVSFLLLVLLPSHHPTHPTKILGSVALLNASEPRASKKRQWAAQAARGEEGRHPQRDDESNKRDAGGAATLGGRPR